MATLKSQIQGLIDYANETTGAGDALLGNAVKTLCDGYGQGGAALNEVDLDKAIVFMDYDGTPIASYTLAEARALTELPDNPYKEVHSRLTYQGWSHTLAEVKAFTYPQYVFAGYTTKSGLMEFVVKVNQSTGMQANIKVGAEERTSATIDWGDGTTENITLTKAFDAVPRTGFVHTYSNEGTYIVRINTPEGGIATNFTYSSISDYAVKEINFTTTKIKMSLYDCSPLEMVSAPMGAIMEQGGFALGAMRLRALPFKQYITNANYRFAGFRRCAGANVEILDENTNASWVNTENFTGVVHIGDAITSIPNGAMGTCRVKCVVMDSITPPTLVGANSFKADAASMRPHFKIYVPDVALESYKTATYWSSLASFIYPLSSIE